MTTSIGERYLARLGVDRPATRDVAALAALLAAHFKTIPFENVSSYTGEGVSVEPADIFAKLLEGRRGGYCMEHAQLAYSALGELGFNVQAVVCRVVLRKDRISARSHRITTVRVDGALYIYDPGFGAQGPTLPLRLDAGDAPQEDENGAWRVRTVAATAGDTIPADLVAPDLTLVVEYLMDGTWTALYGLTDDIVLPADIEAVNWWTATNPASLFVHTLVCASLRDEGRVTVFNKTARKRTQKGQKTCNFESEADVSKWLRDELCLNLSDDQVAAVWKKLTAKA